MKRKLILAALMILAFYGTNKVAHFLLPKWIDIAVGFPLSMYLLYRVGLWYVSVPVVWVYGACNGLIARKHSKKGNVQFVLWKAGEQGHEEDFWIDFDQSHWPLFYEQ